MRHQKVVLTHHKSDSRLVRPVYDLQRIVACITACFISVLNTRQMSFGGLNRNKSKSFEIQNTLLGKTWEQFRLKL